MQIRTILYDNPSVSLFGRHLPLHRGGFGAVQSCKLIQVDNHNDCNL